MGAKTMKTTTPKGMVITQGRVYMGRKERVT